MPSRPAPPSIVSTPRSQRPPAPWGRAIALLRQARGWSRLEAARRCGMSPTTFGRLELGRDSRTEKLRAIAVVFQVPLEEVLVPPIERPRVANDAYLERRIRAGIRAELAAARAEADDATTGRYARALQEADALAAETQARPLDTPRRQRK